MTSLKQKEFTAYHFFCCIGGSAKGWRRGTARVGNMMATWRNIGGCDVDAKAIQQFNRRAGCNGTVIDLFARDQYTAFHGHEPPPEWREATPDDIRISAGGQFPDAVFLSPPCKGFSGLLSETRSLTPKYQALNALTFRSVFLMMEAWKDDPPALVFFENVPRIATRGAAWIDQIVRMMQSYGYAWSATPHNCGKIGRLHQSRERYLMVFRLMAKVPNFLYEPPTHGLRPVGELLEKLPVPGDPLGGPMHRIPMLQAKTWMRLAFVEAGKDWRSLNRLRVENGVLKDYGLVPQEILHNTALGVTRWSDTSVTVRGAARPYNGAFSVGDPRMMPGSDFHGLRVVANDKPSGAVTTQRSPGSSALSVQDPRIDGHPKSVQLGVLRGSDPAGVGTGKMFVGGGYHAVADMRYGAGGLGQHHGKMRVEKNDAATHIVTGSDRVGSGALSVADVRLPSTVFNHAYRIVRLEDHAPAISTASLAVADPRGSVDPNSLHAKYRVTRSDEATRAVIGGGDNGAYSVADPRHGGDYNPNKYRVTRSSEPSNAVISASTSGNGAYAVADVRVGMKADRANYKTNAQYGVMRMDQSSGAVSSSAQHDSGPWSVADHRLPAPNDRLVMLIISEDDTWHRPFTTLELGCLQSYFDPERLHEDGLPDYMGHSDSAWREWIGNLVPPDAAEAMAGVAGRCLLLAGLGETFALSSEAIWVRPIAAAIHLARNTETGD